MSKLRINKVGVLSVAKIYGVMGLVLGLLIGIPYGLFIMIFGAAALCSGAKDAALAGGGVIVMGLVMMVLIPLMYAVMCFIGGIIGALIYNIFAGIVGGIEIEVENV